METYKYTAKNENGKVVKGVLQAADEVDLHIRLKAEKLYLVSSSTVDTRVYTRRLKHQEVSDFCRNVSELTRSGISLVRALTIIAEDESIKPKHKKIYDSILRQVKSGVALSDAIEMQGDAFPKLMINMFRSAESTGNIDGIAMEMAIYYEKEHKLNQKIKSALTYPKMLIFLIIVVVAIIMGYVVPQFKSLFDMMDELPFSTRILMGISDFVKKRWYILIMLTAIVWFVLRFAFKVEEVRYQRDRFLIKMPVFGKLQKVIYTARFARTMASLYSAGIQILNGLEIAKTTIGNAYIERQFDKLVSAVWSGDNLSKAVEEVDGFTKKLVSTIAVGEETGTLDRMLVSAAEQMEYDSEQATARMVSYLEPAMIVVMAVVVGFIIIAVIQPIYGSYESIANMQ